jgi:acetyltransferase
MAAIAAKMDDSAPSGGLHLAPQPAPAPVRAKAATPTKIRPIRPDDEERMIRFHKGLSARSVYMRYFESLSFAVRTAHARLARVCFADSQREVVLVAVQPGAHPAESEIVAVGRLNKVPDAGKAEVALLTLDAFQNRGIGTEMLRQLVQAARTQNLSQLRAEILRDNTAMQRVLKKLGFRLRFIDARSVRATLDL